MDSFQVVLKLLQWKDGRNGGALPFSSLQIVSSTSLKKTAFWKLTGVITEDELSLGIGALGMPGATAWGGLIDVLRPLKDENILITAASGAVGQLVGQLAKARGCRVIGTAGGPVKCALLTDMLVMIRSVMKLASGVPIVMLLIALLR